MSNQSRLTLNVQCQYTADFGKTLEFLRKLNPVAIVACIDSMNAKNRVFELQQALPQAKVISRFVFTQDGGMHTKPQAAGDTRQYVVSPLDALNAWGELGKDGRMLYLLNEPKANDESQENIARLVTWCIEAINLANERGISLCILNFGVGHPSLLGNGEYDARFDEVLKLLSKHRDKHALGIHVYQPADTFTRLDGLIKRCKALGILPPRVHITEAGFDAANGSDALNGYKSRSYSGKQFADFLIDKLRNVYSPYIIDDVLQSIAVFCWGNDVAWKAFNTENDPDWQATIQAAQDKGLLSINPKTDPAYTPAEFVAGGTYTLVIAGSYRNIRETPGLSTSAIVGQIDNGETVTALAQVIKDGDYWWRVKTEKVDGWVSLDGGRVTFRRTLPPPSVPYPEISAAYARQMGQVYRSLGDTHGLMQKDCYKTAEQYEKLAAIVDGTTTKAA